MRRALRALRALALLALALGIAALVGARALAAPLPTGTPEGAEALTDRLLAAVNAEAWERTGAVRWTMFGRAHLWDREHARYRLTEGERVTVLDLHSGRARAWRGASELDERRAEKAGVHAYAIFVNDAWWLNPVVKVRDPGVTRARVLPGDGPRLSGLPGEEGLLATWSSGGLTPGDSYLWWVGGDGLPRAWQMWVSILPIRGISVSWEDWVTLATGARVATAHDFSPGPRLALTGVAGAATLAELEGSDVLLGRAPARELAPDAPIR